MRTANVRFSPRMNWWFYSIFGILFFSGVIWLAVHYLSNDQESGEGNPLEPWMLRIHGAAAMVSLVILGVLIPAHMRKAWAQQRNRVTAVVMVTVCLSMIASGYGLYYCGSDEWRQWISGFHSVAGSSLPLVLIWHILSGRRSKRTSKLSN